MKNLFDNETNNDIQPPKRRFIYLIPLILFFLTIGLIVSGGKEKFLPLPIYDVARARIAESSNIQSAGETLFQAAGWVHADPYPIRATALVSGIVENIFAKGGDTVKKGQTLAILDKQDLKIELRRAQSKLEELKHIKDSYQLNIKVLEAQINENDSFAKTAEASAKTAKNRVKRLTEAGLGVSKFNQEQAELEYQEELSKIAEFKYKNKVIKAQIKQTEHHILTAEYQVKTQQVEIDKILLDISRCEIKSPIDGVIQTMYSRVGRKQMMSSDNEVSTTVAEIFDPTRIIIKVDVPLNEFSKVKMGEKARVRLESISTVLDGYIDAIEGKADYQKNTLEVHVKIPNGHPKLRPDMLAQVEFISGIQEISEHQETKNGTFIHKNTLLNSTLYLVKLDGTVQIKKIETGSQKDGDWVEIRNGLQPGQKAIYSPDANIKAGQKIKIGKLYE